MDDLLRVIENVHVQFDDMRMSEELQILNLSSDLPDDIQVLYLLSVENLHSHFVTRHLMLRGYKQIQTGKLIKNMTYQNIAQCARYINTHFSILRTKIMNVRSIK